ncbi:UNVERIFIED_CONTAM: hypothetical protein GTU68_052093 [Idotea baltica]|nr:hypothetical protein [Idotea baltica]
MDAVQRANSGHPGAPMGMADIAEVLWRDYLIHNPKNPNFINRDRFVLSNGHGSMLIYALLHLTGYDLTIDDLKQFRQLHSRTPGHPEYGYTPGIETTTGPLGQGLANAVGFALSEKILADQFNRLGHDVIDHHTYVFVGDGCLMEGISHEVCSLAGTLGLNKLIAFYDDNGISIDGEVQGWFSDDTPKRFESYGWQVIRHVDGHDDREIKTAIETARKSNKPTLICCKTIIGFGNYLYYGVREFGMSAIMNGLALHGGLIPYGATFLMFMEYARNAVRMSALMKQRVIYVFTHDSIGLGEDGPTHQPVEQLTSLRTTPNLDTWRPCDAVESAAAWVLSIERNDGPSALIFSRQTLQHQKRSAEQIEDIARGGYILRDSSNEPELILIATGSELSIAVAVYERLTSEGKSVRVVSMPCTSVFDRQEASYKQLVLPVQVGARIVIEAAHSDFWYKYVGLEGRIIGMTSYGESAPANELFEYFGITLEHTLTTAYELLED